MPVYDYRCNDCEHTVEVTKKISQSSDPETCPKCEKEMKKMITGTPHVIKKGLGWADG